MEQVLEYGTYIILGLIQGFTEFLPISSSGHLLLFAHYLGFEDLPLLFDILLHVATLLVVIFFYRRVLGEFFITFLVLLKKPSLKALKPRQKHLFWMFCYLTLSTLGTMIVGFYVYRSSIISLFKDPQNVVYLLLAFFITGIVLIFSRYHRQKGSIDEFNAHNFWKKSILIGLIQGLTVIPGISRSGITIVFARFFKLKRPLAVQYAFLLFIPAVLGALILDISSYFTTDSKELGDITTLAIRPEGVLLAFLAALISGFFALRWLIFLLKKDTFYLFSLYLFSLILLNAFFY